MTPYISESIKEYPKGYMVRRYPHLTISNHVREFTISPRLFNTSIGRIFVTPAVAPKTSFGSNTKIIFVNDFEKLMNGSDPTLCNIVKTIQPFQVLKYLEKNILNEKIIETLQRYIKKESGYIEYKES